jgi:hypothetical protein
MMTDWHRMPVDRGRRRPWSRLSRSESTRRAGTAGGRPPGLQVEFNVTWQRRRLQQHSPAATVTVAPRRQTPAPTVIK